MKVAMIIVILLSIITVNVSAQKLGIYVISSIDTKNEIKASPIVDFYISKSLNKKFSLSTYLYFSQGWSEAMLYLDYSPKSWIIISVGAGIEQSKKMLRGTACLWLGKKNWSLMNIYEIGYGQNNYWYKSQFNYQLSEKVGVGYLAKRYFGVGPVLKISVNKDIELWTAPMHDFEAKQNKLAGGISIKF